MQELVGSMCVSIIESPKVLFKGSLSRGLQGSVVLAIKVSGAGWGLGFETEPETHARNHNR